MIRPQRNRVTFRPDRVYSPNLPFLVFVQHAMSRFRIRTLLIPAFLSAIVSTQAQPAAAASGTNDQTAEQQTKVQQSTPPPAPEAPPLTLDACIALALKKNFDLTIENYSVDQAREALIMAQANFDPTLTASALRSVSQAASSTNTLDGTTQQGPRADSTSFQVGASERIPQTNGLFGLSANATRDASNSSYSLLNPAFGNGISASISQPLLKNAGAINAKSRVERSQIGVSIATLNYKSRVLSVIRDTENAYYNLVAWRETVRIRQLSFELAQKLYEENQARRASGMATDLDVATAEVGIANARRAVIQADEAMRNAEDSLLSLINSGNLDARPGPVAFNDYNEPPPSFTTAYKLARDYYPDTLSAQDTIKQLEIDLAVAKRNQLPQLDLNASLGYTARSTSEGYWQTIDNLPSDHGNRWTVGVTYSMPWGRRADKANYRSTLAGLNAQKTRLEQLELQLLVSVRTAVRAVESNLASVQIASQATQLAAKQYDLQKARYDAGLATSRLVLQAQDDLETARMNELSAKASLWSAVAELHRLEGTSLEQFHVNLQ
jgi:outer membrane protein